MARAEWWGAFRLEEGQRGHWTVGPLQLWVERRPHEWRVTHRRSSDHLDDAVEVRVPAADAEPPAGDGVEQARFALRETRERLAVLPKLADRAVVARPATPLHLVAGEEATLYVSTPMWVELQADGDLIELPSFRPSDTWFGPDTMRGELCYASRTAAELDLESLVVRPARAITTVTLRNRADDPVLVERINLPVQHLSLFVDDSLAFWTERITVTREEDGAASPVRVEAGPPPDAPEAERIADPRRDRDRSKMIRAFSALLG